MNSTLAQRLEVLSPSKRALLEKRFGKAISRSTTTPCVIGSRPHRSTAPLCFNQEGLLFMEQLDRGTSRYNVVDAVRIRGSFDSDLARQALDLIVERHEALRTVFTEVDGVWQQTILPYTAAKMDEVDLGSTTGRDPQEIALELIQAESDRPMDLFNGPLFTSTLVRVAERDTFMLIKMHHILSDGWSLGVFWKEFSHIYSALLNGVRPDLPVLPIQFGDFAFWSREYLQGEIDRQTRYWSEKLNGAPGLLEMPTDRPRPAVQTSNGAQEIVHFPQTLLSGLGRICKTEGSTLYMTLLAAFNALLARYTGAEDLVIGTPIAGRSRTETENLIGYFVNTLVLRSDLSGNPTFREVLRQTRSTVLDAFSHQELPFEKVVAAVKPERSLSYNPIYQVAFALQESSTTKVSIPEADIQPVKLGLNTSKFDIFLSARETDAGFAVTVEYNTDLFNRETIQRLISHYGNVLEAIVKDPDKRLYDLPIISDDEKYRTVVEWNKTSTEYAREPIDKLFESKAADSPTSVAIVQDGAEITYGKLSEWSSKIANFLRNAGVAKGERIGICLDRSPEMIAATIGILKCGAVYVPMDPANPPSRLQQLIEDSSLQTILTNSEHKEVFRGNKINIIDVEAEREAIERSSAEVACVEQDAEATAYVMYTSGSTGKPKGALVPHRAIARLVLNTNYIQLNETDRIAHVSNVAFDAATFEIWGALLNGGRIVIFDKDLVLSPRNFASELNAAGITAMFLTTSLFNLIAREVPDAFANVGTLMTGGEQFDPAAARSVFASGPPKRLLNVYGPTESTTFAAWKEVSEISAESRIIPIGKPIANTTMFLLDGAFNPVPVGVVGEIFIGGDGLANGYLNRPELNSERFIEVSSEKFSVPSRQGCATKLYRTGDLAKYLPNGDIEYLGRKDNQIKMRGFRIELGEIEAALVSHPKVSEAIVLAVRDEVDHRIAAFYVPQIGQQVDLSELREFVRHLLPGYMVPVSWTEMQEFPINANGKIDRICLERMAAFPEERHVEVQDDPSDELEVKLTWIWRKVLGVNRLGVNDNFFDLGGHSLAAVKMFSNIEKELGCRLPLAAIFRAPTVTELSTMIREGGWTSRWRSLVPIRPLGTKPPFFCVHAVGGNILEYNSLAGNLGPDQPYYGLQSVGLDGNSAPITEIRAMAAVYIGEIKAVQPKGPYYLGGRSFGGTVAFEMARQLRAEGEKIALLAIFDSYPKGWQKLCTTETAREYSRQFMRLRIQRHLDLWLRLGLIEKLQYAVSKIRYKSKKLKNLFWRPLRNLLPGQSSVGAVIREIEDLNYVAWRSYVPSVYEGNVTFFCAEGEVCPEENIKGWELMAKGGVDIVKVPGDHQTMIKEPHVITLAAKLEEVLNDRALELSKEQP